MSKESKEMSEYLSKKGWTFERYSDIDRVYSFYFKENDSDDEPISVLGFGQEKLQKPAIFYITKNKTYINELLSEIKNIKKPLNVVEGRKNNKVVFYSFGKSIVVINFKENMTKYKLQMISKEDYELNKKYFEK